LLFRNIWVEKIGLKAIGRGLQSVRRGVFGAPWRSTRPFLDSLKTEGSNQIFMAKKRGGK
jgi:hypothetical protein